MAPKKKKTPRVHVPTLAEQFPPGFDPEPTVFKGGVDKLVEIWETMRGNNSLGYGGAIVQAIKGWAVDELKGTTCSPFTGNVFGITCDPTGAISGNNIQPMYDGGTKPLPSAFYAMHNGFYFEGKDAKARPRWDHFSRNGWKWVNSSAESAIFFRLAYEIEAKDLRRGDMVGINWSNHGGHAVFIWDVHLDANGEVDCFQLLSSNGTQNPKGTYKGAGITIHGCDTGTPKSGAQPYIVGERGKYRKGYDPLFVDRPSHIVDGTWYCIPGKYAKDIDKSTFKDSGSKHGNDGMVFYDMSMVPKKPKTWPVAKKWVPRWPVAVESLTACRLYGFPPPDRDPGKDRLRTEWERAKQYVQSGCTLKESFATGKGPAPAEHHIENAPPSVAKGNPEKIKDAPPKKAPQQDNKPTALQLYVERGLQKLYEAKWLDKGPGDLTNVNDQETKDAIKEFKTKWKIEPVDDVANPKLRDALEDALAQLEHQLHPPHVQAPPPKPKILDAAFITNRIDEHGQAYLYVHGTDLDFVKKLSITLEDKKSKHTENVDWKMELHDDIGKTPVKFPKAFKHGAEIVAKLSGSAMTGESVSFEIKAPVYVGHIKPPESDWPWDERLWTAKMRDIITWCRKVQKPTGPFQEFEITQYGVKEKLEPGDVEVKSPDGDVFGKISRHSLMLADIEGTMRLNGRILNIAKSGNVYEEKQVEVAGKIVTKKKPNREKFDPKKSLWHDVTAKAPWGSGSKQPLVPFRTLALNPGHNKHLYGKHVYIKQLDGMELPNGEIHNGICICGDAGGMRKEHFDLFVGREDHHIAIPSIRRGGATICEIQILG